MALEKPLNKRFFAYIGFSAHLPPKNQNTAVRRGKIKFRVYREPEHSPWANRLKAMLCTYAEI